MGASIIDGEFTNPELLVRARNPSSLVVTADGCRVYAALEVTEFDGQQGGGVATLGREPRSGRLRMLGMVPSGGVEPADLALDRAEQVVAVANYRSGSVATLRVLKDRTLGPPENIAHHRGHSVDPVRQASAHPHQVVFDPTTGELLVPDLGLDAIVTYRVGPDAGLQEVRRIAVEPGSGPRHLSFHPDGQHFFLVSELANSITVFRRVGESFIPIQALSTLSAADTLPNTASEVACSGSGRTVLVSNRGNDTLAVYEFDVRRDLLSLALTEHSGGSWPKGFGLVGNRLFVANLKSDSIEEFELDEEGPSLRLRGSTRVASPASVIAAPYA